MQDGSARTGLGEWVSRLQAGHFFATYCLTQRPIAGGGGTLTNCHHWTKPTDNNASALGLRDSIDFLTRRNLSNPYALPRYALRRFPLVEFHR